MLKKFLFGFIIGTGFSVAALCVYTAWMFYVLPPLIDQNFTSEVLTSENPRQRPYSSNTPNFHELSVDEKIELATAIIIVKSEKGENGENGKYKNVVDDILKLKRV